MGRGRENRRLKLRINFIPFKNTQPNIVAFDDLKAYAQSQGMEVVGALSAKDLTLALRRRRMALQAWQESGYAGEMAYMQRSPDLLCDPTNLLPEIKSILTFIVPYSSPHKRDDELKQGHGKIARYARGLDYHTVLRKKLNSFIEALRKDGIYNGKFNRVFSDSVPLLERSVAEQAKLGFIGKSSMLIRPRMGTYFFICELLWDVEVSQQNEMSYIKSSCGKCEACKSYCPTGAIVNDRVIDSRKCISYLTIEKKSLFDESDIAATGDWLFGCDICQEVCPFNHAGNQVQVMSEFLQHGVKASQIDLASVLSLKSSEEFRFKFKDTALLRTKREGLLRNAMAVVANQRFFPYLNYIIEICTVDPSDFLRAQAEVVLKILKADAMGLDRIKIERCLE